MQPKKGKSVFDDTKRVLSLAKFMKVFCRKKTPSSIRYLLSTLCYYCVMYAFQSELALYSWLNVKELLAQSRREIWSFSDCNWTRTHNYFVHKRTLNHLVKLAIWSLSDCNRTRVRNHLVQKRTFNHLSKLTCLKFIIATELEPTTN